MAKLIIIAGYLAALKSTLASRLEHDLNIMRLSKDSVKEVLGDTIGFNTREDNKNLSQTTFNLMRMFAEQCLTHQHSIMLESNFKSNDYKALKTMKHYDDTHTLTIFSYGDLEVLYQRFNAREKVRHPVHKAFPITHVDVFKEAQEDYQVSDALGKVITVDTTRFTEEDYQKLKDSIIKWKDESDETSHN